MPKLEGISKFFSKLSKEEKTVFIVTGVLVSAAFFDMAIIRPFTDKMTEIKDVIALKEKSLRLYLANLSQKDMILKKYEGYSQYIEKIGTDEESQAAILQELEAIALDSGVALTDVKPYPPKSTRFYKEFSMDLQLEEPMDKIIIFLYKLNNSPQLIRGDKLRLNLDSQNMAIIKAEITVSKVASP